MIKKRLLQFMVLVSAASLCVSCGKKQNDKNQMITVEPVQETEAAKEAKTGQETKTEQEAASNLTIYGGINIEQVSKCFQQIQNIFDQDNGSMWGKKLVFRLMIVNYETHEIITNCQSKSGLFTQNGEVYIGKLPEDMIISNSTTDYDGEQWSTVLTDSFNGDMEDKLTICTHELFHLNQPLLGMPGTDYNNPQMDEMDARVNLKLEWDALEKAIHAKGDEKKEHVLAALAFRSARRKEYDHAKDEDVFEVMEGMAEYTSDILVNGLDQVISKDIPAMKSRCESESEVPSYVRFFGYYSGLLYGTLLDQYSSDWRTGLTSDSNLGDLLAQKADIKQADIDHEMTLMDSIKENYNYDNIYSYEQDRKERQDKKKAEAIDTLVKGKIVKVQFLSGMNYSFDPQRISTLDPYGTIYGGFNCSDEWGVFESSDVSVLVSTDEKEFCVNAESLEQEGNVIKGKGWSLTLSDGYQLNQLKDGNYEVIKER